MKALVLGRDALAVQDIPAPRCQWPDDVIVDVAFAGVCRTDCYVAAGLIPVRRPLVLGHELAGTVREAGAASGFAPGDRVACMPLLGCGGCAVCSAGRGHACARGQMLGMDRDGAFAEQVRVPGSALARVPAKLSLRQAAFAEPVAAAMAVLDAGMERSQRGLVLGAGRIARLTLRVLERAGFGRVEARPAPRSAPEAAPETTTDAALADPADSFDFVIETGARAPALDTAIALLRPRGTLVLKSRPPGPAALDVAACVRKELRLVGAYYAPLAAALDAMRAGGLQVDDLLGADHALADHAAVIAAELDGEETRKQLFAIGG